MWMVEDVPGAYIAVHGRRGPLLRFSCDPALPKPSWTHLATTAGHAVALNMPFDHVHHRGAMLTWSDVNGINFWEEDRGPAVTGRILWRGRHIEHPQADEVTVHGDGDWLQPDGQVLLRQRLAFSARLLPEPGAWRLVVDTYLEACDWAVTFGTPPPYNGFGLRLVRALQVRPQLSDSLGDRAAAGTQGRPAVWCDYSGSLDGGTGPAGVTLISHPANRPHPMPFFVLKGEMAYLAAAPTYDTPHTVLPGQPWRLSFGVVVHEGVANPATCDAWAAALAVARRPLDGVASGCVG